MRTFMRIDFYNEQVPDATTLLKFRHLFEKHQMGEKIFSNLKERLDFGYCKVVYKGIAKNMNRFNLLFACANLLMCVRANRNLAPIVG